MSKFFNYFFGTEEKVICPDCKSDKWIKGPSGGASVNIMCANCEEWFNYEGPFGLDRIYQRGPRKISYPRPTVSDREQA